MPTKGPLSPRIIHYTYFLRTYLPTSLPFFLPLVSLLHFVDFQLGELTASSVGMECFSKLLSRELGGGMEREWGRAGVPMDSQLVCIVERKSPAK